MSRLAATLCLLLAVALVLATGGSEADAYMSIRVPVGTAAEGLPVRWDLNNTAGRPNIANRRVLYEISDFGCADAAGFIGPINEFEAIQNSFANWRNVHESDMDFEFAGSTTNAVSSASDNRNVIRWVNSNIATGVFAVTITTFSTTTGQIVDADMELNDRDFTWDTLGPNATTGIIGRAMIENVVTHEIGHIVGLDHPANAQSSLYFASSPGQINQTRLNADDKAPLIADHTNAAVVDASLGTVTGSVAQGGNPQFGAGVYLVNVSTGRNVIGHASEGTGPFVNGSFRIDNVPPGNYLAYALPIDRGALGSYYSTAFVNFFPVVRGVPVGTVGAPTLVSVAPGATVSGVSIDLPTLPQTPFEPDNNSGTATALASGDAGVSVISPATEEAWYSFTTTQAGQEVRIRVLAHTFGSTLNPTLTMYDTNGSTLLVSPDFGEATYLASANDIDETAFDINGINRDAEIIRTMGAAGTYFFKVASRVGVTSGPYVVMLEVTGADMAADPVASLIEASTTGVAANSATTFEIDVTPRNVFGRDLNAPSTFTIDLVDVTGTPTVLQTINTSSTPFVFTVSAAATAQVVRYSARIDGADIGSSVRVSHYGTLSTTNSRITLLESTLNANGYDRIPVRIELRDGSNNNLPDNTIPVTVSTTAGTLDNGSATGASNVAAVFDPGTGFWFIELVAPASAGTATLTAFANAVQIDSKQVAILARATGTGGGTPPTGGKDKDDDGGGCVVGDSPALWALLALSMVVLALRSARRVRAQDPV